MSDTDIVCIDLLSSDEDDVDFKPIKNNIGSTPIITLEESEENGQPVRNSSSNDPTPLITLESDENRQSVLPSSSNNIHRIQPTPLITVEPESEGNRQSSLPSSSNNIHRIQPTPLITVEPESEGNRQSSLPSSSNNIHRIHPTTPLITLESDEDVEDEAVHKVDLELEILSSVSIDIDSGGSVVGVDDFSTEASRNIDQLLAVACPRVSFKDRPKLKKKMWSSYDKLKTAPLTLHSKLSVLVADTTLKIQNNPELKVWTFLSCLLKYFNADKLKEPTCPTNIDDVLTEDKLDEKREKLILQLEKAMEKMSKRIQSLDEEEVDWNSDDEHNSSYMLRDRYMAKLNKIYNQLCQIKKCSKQTGRPVQKAMKLNATTKYPEFERAVENIVNSKGYLQAPDFWDVFNVIKKTNSEASLHLAEDDLRSISKDLHEKVIRTIQKRRASDSLLAFPSNCDAILISKDDPSENDIELKTKLEDNAKSARSIDDVVKEFVKKQESTPLEPELTDEDDNKSPLQSDAESEDDYVVGSDDNDSCIKSLNEMEEGIPAGAETLYDDDEDEDQLLQSSSHNLKQEDDDEVNSVQEAECVVSQSNSNGTISGESTLPSSLNVSENCNNNDNESNSSTACLDKNSNIQGKNPNPASVNAKDNSSNGHLEVALDIEPPPLKKRKPNTTENKTVDEIEEIPL